jgi:hypothetical protein
MQNEMNIALFNSRSVREPVKKAYMRNVFLLNEVSIFAIVETFLTKQDNFYLRDFKIYRSDAENRRKGVMIGVRKSLNCKTEVIETDQDGRFIKVSITDNFSRKSRTVGAAYIQPTSVNKIQIPESLLNADIFIGDVNGMPTAFKESGVYQYSNNCTILKEVIVPQGLSDHNVLILRVNTPFKLEEKETTYKTLDKLTLELNNAQIRNKLCQQNVGNPNVTIKLHDPRQIRFRRKTEEVISIEGFDDYTNMKEQAKRDFLEFINMEKRKMSAIISNGQISRTSWMRIDNFLTAKTSTKLYFPDENRESIIQGFKRLY